jgi:hypothetical protein
MAGKPKVVRKAEKAAVRAASTSQVVGSMGTGTVIKDLGKSIKANKRAGTKITAGSVPGSVADRNSRLKGDGSKRSSAKKTLAKRVNQSVVARGGTPSSSYVTKRKAAEIDLRSRMSKAGSNPKSKQAALAGNPNPKSTRKDLSKNKLDGRGGYN